LENNFSETTFQETNKQSINNTTFCIVLIVGTSYLNSRRLFFEKWFPENHFFKFFCGWLPLEKLINRKNFTVKRKFGLIFIKVFSFYFERKTLSGSCEKFRNVILFADYIKSGTQTCDCYIYLVLNIYFSVSSLPI
jgi:hypothetical protein